MNWSKKIEKDWNEPVSNAQIEAGQHAPVEVNNKPTCIHIDAAMRMFGLIYEELLEYRDAVINTELTPKERITEIADALCDISYLTDGLIAQHGLNESIEDLKEEVHRSNLTKLQNGKIVIRAEDGKILKPDSYEPPKLLLHFNP